MLSLTWHGWMTHDSPYFNLIYGCQHLESSLGTWTIKPGNSGYFLCCTSCLCRELQENVIVCALWNFTKYVSWQICIGDLYFLPFYAKYTLKALWKNSRWWAYVLIITESWFFCHSTDLSYSTRCTANYML